MNLEQYSNTELVQVRDDLRAMCVSQDVIDYVLCSLRMAFVAGGKSAYHKAIGGPQTVQEFLGISKKTIENPFSIFKPLSIPGAYGEDC